MSRKRRSPGSPRRGRAGHEWDDHDAVRLLVVCTGTGAKKHAPVIVAEFWREASQPVRHDLRARVNGDLREGPCGKCGRVADLSEVTERELHSILNATELGRVLRYDLRAHRLLDS